MSRSEDSQSADDSSNDAVRAQIFDPRLAAVDLQGSVLNNDLVGTAWASAIAGGHGADRLAGAGGTDRIHGNAGNDSIFGGWATTCYGETTPTIASTVAPAATSSTEAAATTR